MTSLLIVGSSGTHRRRMTRGRMTYHLPMASPRTAPMLIKPEDAHPELGTLRNAIAIRDWRIVEQLMAGLPDDTARTYAMNEAAAVSGSDEFLSGMVAAEPNAPLPRAMLAYRYIWLAWDARTAARAVHVSPKQFEVFHHYLNLAEEQLTVLAARHPTYQPTYPARLTTAMGLQMGMREAEQRYWAAGDPYCSGKTPGPPPPACRCRPLGDRDGYLPFS